MTHLSKVRSSNLFIEFLVSYKNVGQLKQFFSFSKWQWNRILNSFILSLDVGKCIFFKTLKIIYVMIKYRIWIYWFCVITIFITGKQWSLKVSINIISVQIIWNVITVLHVLSSCNNKDIHRKCLVFFKDVRFYRLL